MKDATQNTEAPETTWRLKAVEVESEHKWTWTEEVSKTDLRRLQTALKSIQDYDGSFTPFESFLVSLLDAR